MMTKEEIKERMNSIDKIYDNESFSNAKEDWHRAADNLLVEVLRSEGHEDLADWFESTGKWYA